MPTWGFGELGCCPPLTAAPSGQGGGSRLGLLLLQPRRQWRRRRGELAVTPQPQASCPQRGGALRSQARPPPLPACPGLPGVGSPSPLPAPQLHPPDLNRQHCLPEGPQQRGRFFTPRSTCSFRIIAFEVKTSFSLSLKGPLPPPPTLLQLGKLRTRWGQALPKFSVSLPQNVVTRATADPVTMSLPSSGAGHWGWGCWTMGSSRRPFP